MGFGKACVGNGLLHTQVSVARGIAHKTPAFAVDSSGKIDVRRAPDVGSHARVGVLLAVAYAGASEFQRFGHGSHIVTQAGHDAQAGYNHPLAHQKASVDWNRPTRRSFAV